MRRPAKLAGKFSDAHDATNAAFSATWASTCAEERDMQRAILMSLMGGAGARAELD